ncbi:PepSY domain-containing protein [Herminiimonas sp. CN]|uniref:PepSY domain-containing protein n=1 Tax=Herminiimonas sp. CN TaxID=1349818 RepID=UPI000683DE9B|nr:PepSY domain-containing protein [Herminiimonas sp. CN]
MKTLRLFLFSVALALAAGGLHADDDGDEHDRARAAVAAGQIKPLSEIMDQVEQRYAGRMVKSELERYDGIWVYELKLLPPNGRVYKLKINAQTGRVIGTRGQVQEKR